MLNVSLFTDGDSKKDGAEVKKKTEDQLFHEQLAKEVEAIVAPGSNKLFASLACRSIRVGKSTLFNMQILF